MRAFLLLFLLAALGGCAHTPENTRLREVRAFAGEAPKLAGFADLSQRFRDTFQREQPYLNAASVRTEIQLDDRRREAYPDFVALHQSVVLYMRALGALADGGAYDPGDQVKGLAAGIKAWPDTGLTDRHVNAYAGLARVLARVFTTRAQDQAVQALLREGYTPLQESLDAMAVLLRHFDKHHDNEQAIVLGMLDVEIPFANTPRDRLLAAIAKSHRQEKVREYQLLGLRHTLALQHVEAIRKQHEALVLQAALQGATRAAVATPAAIQGATP
jgi:hypothetical protein